MADGQDRVGLEAITPALAARIVSRDETPADHWHPEYPFEDELALLVGLADAVEVDPVFGLYLIRRTSDGQAVGGCGFFGPPDGAGEVEIGYGLVPSARGAGLGSAVVVDLLAIAAANGVRSVTARTEPGNLASQRVLTKSGFTLVGRDGELLAFRHSL